MSIQGLVREFRRCKHEAQGVDDDPVTPMLPTVEQHDLAARLLVEEFSEIMMALYPNDVYPWAAFREKAFKLIDEYVGMHPTIALVAHELADLAIVTEGCAQTFGIRSAPVVAEVMRSNMSKLDGATFRDDGKILKGPHYIPPDVVGVLDDQRLAGKL